jgi:hypothetical protein
MKKKVPPQFRIIQSGSCYYVYLAQGRCLVNYFGKIVERCSTKSGSRFTYVKLKFDRLAKLQMTKGITFFGTMDNNKSFKLKQKDWFIPFQRAVLLSISVDRQNRRMLAKRSLKIRI